MRIFIFYVNVLLRYVFKETSEEERQLVEGDREVKKKPYYIGLIDNMLDLDGPKLLGGSRLWILFYQVVGQINWLKRPLYMCILYKIIVISFGAYTVLFRLVGPLIISDSFKLSFRNPIVIFISSMGFIASSLHFMVTVYTNLFNLSPMLKIITSPRLCFLSRETQLIFGDESFFLVSLMMIYNTLLVKMIVCENFQQFLESFSILEFVLDLFGHTVIWYHTIGLANYDLYLRSSFGCWILALKFNLESRFARFNVHQRRKISECLENLNRPTGMQQNESNNGVVIETDDYNESKSRGFSFSSSAGLHTTGYVDVYSGYDNNTLDYKFVTLDEIKRSLNNMDDNLEVWRMVQTNSLVLIRLAAFLAIAGLLLVAYNMVANEGNYYHGMIVLAVALSYWFMISICYLGDSWLAYALNKFVQTVEDEYFLQGADDDADRLVPDLVLREFRNHHRRSRDLIDGSQLALSGLSENLAIQYKSLMIKKVDVLFCHEFLHQFENHLATPWSNLCFKSHFRMLGTFVTLIAAHIIFSSEHVN